MFAGYDKALLARDFTTACSHMALSTSQGMITALAAGGAQVTSCEEALTAVYAVPEAAGSLDEAARSATITDVAVDGDIARVTYSGEAGGRRSTGLVQKMQRTDGRWLLLGNDA